MKMRRRMMRLASLQNWYEENLTYSLMDSSPFRITDNSEENPHHAGKSFKRKRKRE